MRRCTGFSPSRASGRARSVTTDRPYVAKARSSRAPNSSSLTSPPAPAPVERSPAGPGVARYGRFGGGGVVASDIDFLDLAGVAGQELPALLGVSLFHQGPHQPGGGDGIVEGDPLQ